ncbi:MAG: hypothetical protein ACYS5F_14610 [Planctomycetota bacterium]|jgi:hypothetical protein
MPKIFKTEWYEKELEKRRQMDSKFFAESDMRDDMVDLLRKEMFKKEARSVRQSLEDALQATTPDEPGDPRDGRKTRLRNVKEEDDCWI